MVHSGAVVATTLSSGNVKNDEEMRTAVACGAASGVTTAFSAPIGNLVPCILSDVCKLLPVK
jgi:H+/Cl- antiporter ClcA